VKSAVFTGEQFHLDTYWRGSSKRGVPDVSYDADPNTGVPVYMSNYYGSFPR
jgi:hypothetical protein